MSETIYEMRALKSSDLFVVSKILNNIGFREFKDILTKENVSSIMQMSNADSQDQEDSQEQMVATVGFTIIMQIAEIVIANLASCEQDIYQFVSALTGMDTKTIADLPMVDFTEIVIQIVQKEEFKDFIKVVSKLFK